MASKDLDKLKFKFLVNQHVILTSALSVIIFGLWANAFFPIGLETCAVPPSYKDFVLIQVLLASWSILVLNSKFLWTCYVSSIFGYALCLILEVNDVSERLQCIAMIPCMFVFGNLIIAVKRRKDILNKIGLKSNHKLDSINYCI